MLILSREVTPPIECCMIIAGRLRYTGRGPNPSVYGRIVKAYISLALGKGTSQHVQMGNTREKLGLTFCLSVVSPQGIIWVFIGIKNGTHSQIEFLLKLCSIHKFCILHSHGVFSPNGQFFTNFRKKAPFPKYLDKALYAHYSFRKSINCICLTEKTLIRLQMQFDQYSLFASEGEQTYLHGCCLFYKGYNFNDSSWYITL